MSAERDLLAADKPPRGLSSAVKGVRWVVLALNLLVLPMTAVLLYVGRVMAERLERETEATLPAFSQTVLAIWPFTPLVVLLVLIVALVAVNRLMPGWSPVLVELGVGVLVALFGVAVIVAVVLLWARAMQGLAQI